MLSIQKYQKKAVSRKKKDIEGFADDVIEKEYRKLDTDDFDEDFLNEDLDDE